MAQLTIYKASAGSGKTYTLALDYILMMFEHVAGNNDAIRHPNRSHKELQNLHRHLLAVTFTNKATNEMKSRIIKELYTLACGKQSKYRDEIRKRINATNSTIHLQQSDADDALINSWCRIFLDEILDDYSLFSITTIDSFFQKIVRNFARELGLSGGYTVDMDELQIRSMAIDNMLYDIDQHQTLKQWLRQMIEDNIDNGKNWKIQNTILKMANILFNEQFRQLINKPEIIKLFNNPTPAKKILQQIKDEKQPAINKLCEKVTVIMNTYQLGTDCLKNDWNSLAQREEPLTDTFIGATTDIALCINAPTRKKYPIQCQEAYDNGLRQCHQEAIRIFSRYLTAKYALNTFYITGIVGTLDQQIDADNRELNRLPIADTNRRINQIIDNSDIPFIYEKISQRIKHYLIDEFQDTSRLQWENFFPLLKENLDNGNRSLIVGDVKQSIYRWRNGDADLLANHIETQLPQQQINNKTLDANYRSSEQIINWNNDFFDFLTNNATINYQKHENTLRPAIKRYYDESINQKTNPDNHYSGLVRATFITPPEKEDKENTYSTLLEPQLISLIQELKQRGIQLSRVAIIVRYNKDGKQIASMLTQHGIKVVSDESLTLMSAISVRLIISIFQHIEREKESIYIYNAYRYFAALLNKDNEWVIEQTKNETDPESNIDSLLNKAVEITKQTDTLYHKTELLINWLTRGCDCIDHNPTTSETAYLQALLDNIHHFGTNQSTNIHSFLQWWELKKETLAIPAPQQDDALQIITIHKSKGLEFDVTIIPYCNWAMANTANELLWIDTQIENMDDDFKQIPILPIYAISKLAHTQCAKSYYNEYLHSLLDSFNSAYVAFTRPRHELYIFAPINNIPKSGISNIGQAVRQYITDRLQLENISTCDKTEVYQLSMDENKTDWITKPQQTSVNQSIILPDILKSDKLDNHINLQEIATEETRRGNLLHDIMSRVKYADQLENALLSVCIGSDKQQIDTIRHQLTQLINLPQVKPWFENDHIVMNELELLTPSGKTYRPDRVMLYPDGNIIVIDYKFTQHKSANYNRQISQYIKLLKEAIPYYQYGTTMVNTKHITGYLLYADSKTIEQV